MSLHTLLLSDHQLAVILSHLKNSVLPVEAHALYRAIVAQLDLEGVVKDPEECV